MDLPRPLLGRGPLWFDSCKRPPPVSDHCVFAFWVVAYRSLPCEQRLHFRNMRWRAKSSLCRQPFNFLSCMRKIRHAIRKQLVRQICVSFAGIKFGKTTCEQLSSSFCFVFLLCPSGLKYFSRYMSWDRLLRKHYATNCSKSCLI